MAAWGHFRGRPQAWDSALVSDSVRAPSGLSLWGCLCPAGRSEAIHFSRKPFRTDLALGCLQLFLKVSPAPARTSRALLGKVCFSCFGNKVYLLTTNHLQRVPTMLFQRRA